MAHIGLYGLIQTAYSSPQLIQSGYPSGRLVLNSQHFVCIHKVTSHTYNLAITIYGFASAATLAFHPDSAGLLWSNRSSSILTFITRLHADSCLCFVRRFHYHFSSFYLCFFSIWCLLIRSTRDYHGFGYPHGLRVGVAGVRVRVGFSDPRITPTLTTGWR